MKSLADIRRGIWVVREDAENSPSHVASPGQSTLAIAMHNMYHISTLASDLYQLMADTDQVDANDVGSIQKAYDILSAIHDKANKKQEDEGIQNYP